MSQEAKEPGGAMIIAGATRPASREEVNGLLQRFLVHAKAAEELRARIAKGKAIIATADPEKVDVEGAKVHLAELETEERREGWGEMIAMAVALGHGAAGLLNEAAEAGSWAPPAGSMVRIKLPGMLDLTIDMNDYAAKVKAASGG